MFSCDVTKARSFARNFSLGIIVYLYTVTFPIGSMENVITSC